MKDAAVIVATYGRPGWLGESLASVRLAARTAGVDVQIIVVDDFSPPNDAVHVVATRSDAIYTRMPQRSGTSRARIAGYCLVDAPFFAFFDDDDIMLPNWFELHLAEMERGADVVSSAHWNTDAHLHPQHLRRLPAQTLDDLIAGRVTANDGSLIRRDAMREIAWRVDREHVMLYSMWLALASRGATFAMIPEPTWLYRWHGGNQTPSTRDERDAEFRRQAVAEYAVPA